MLSFIKFSFVLMAAILFNFASIGNVFAESKVGDVFTDRFETDDGSVVPLVKGEWTLFKKSSENDLAKNKFLIHILRNNSEQSISKLIVIGESRNKSEWLGNGHCAEMQRRALNYFSKQGTEPSSLNSKCSSMSIYSYLSNIGFGFPVNRSSESYVATLDFLLPIVKKDKDTILVNTFTLDKYRGSRLITMVIDVVPTLEYNNLSQYSRGGILFDLITNWHARYIKNIESSIVDNKFQSFLSSLDYNNFEQKIYSLNKDGYSDDTKLKEQQDLLLAEQKAKDQLRLAEEAKLKEQQRLALEAQQKEQLRLAQEAKQKEQERLLADQKVKEQLRIAEETAKANALELAKLKQELASIKLKNEQATPAPSARKALVIGNDSYFNVTKLSNARQDANAVGRTLSDLGYKVMVKNDLTEKDMKATLRQFKNDLEGGDEVVIFYAGHGIQIGSTNYLLPTDIKGESEDQVRDDAIQLQRLLDDMNEKKVKLTLAMIDACRDNPFPKAGRAIGSRGLAPTTAATGQMIIFSAGSGQQALDKLGPNDKNPNGLFTRMLLSEMKTQGVRVDNMIREVRRKVVDAAKSVGHEQVPAIYDQVVGDFYFNK